MMAKYTIHYFVKIDSEKMSLTHYCHYYSFTVIKKKVIMHKDMDIIKCIERYEVFSSSLYHYGETI